MNATYPWEWIILYHWLDGYTYDLLATLPDVHKRVKELRENGAVEIKAFQAHQLREDMFQ